MLSFKVVHLKYLLPLNIGKSELILSAITRLEKYRQLKYLEMLL